MLSFKGQDPGEDNSETVINPQKVYILTLVGEMKEGGSSVGELVCLAVRLNNFLLELYICDDPTNLSLVVPWTWASA